MCWDDLKPKSYAQWQTTLKDAYNLKHRKPDVTRMIDEKDLPEFNKKVSFFNVPRVANMIFSLRVQEKPALPL